MLSKNAMFDEDPAITRQDIKETKHYGPTGGRTDNIKTVYPPQTKFVGGIKTHHNLHHYIHMDESSKFQKS